MPRILHDQQQLDEITDCVKFWSMTDAGGKPTRLLIQGVLLIKPHCRAA